MDLSNNKLQSIDDDTINAMNGLQNIYLGNNPWNCDCFARKLGMYVQTFGASKIKDTGDIKCHSDGKLLKSIDFDEICSNSKWLILGCSFAILGLISGCFTALYYFYSVEIKGWLNTHNSCLRVESVGLDAITERLITT